MYFKMAISIWKCQKPDISYSPRREGGHLFLLYWQNVKIRTLALIIMLHEYMHSVCPTY